ncbi:DUF2189 domain-containing protein [Aquicoccus porphyridii]|uniref:DUF2189 domain-containing protein n=1 Tax=Aquicoccus porphyridii TaxID=1852029 RepID=UPI00273E2D3F|nr:DUF2189 domain-containing protein [Aquicoccus porphyridii]
MVQTIGNPASWGARQVRGAGHALAEMTRSLGSDPTADLPEVNRITLDDIRTALRLGARDAARFRSDVAALLLIYPVLGLALAYVAFQQSLIHLIFPLAAGFALIGPVAAILFYELSRQSETDQPVTWPAALGHLRRTAIAPVIVLGLYLFAIFLVWMAAAYGIYQATLGPIQPETHLAFLQAVLTTPAGWTMIVIGFGVGFVFAALVLVTAAFSFPMLIDRAPGLPVAVATSLRVARQNPVTVAAWGLTVAILLALGSLPFFLGLILVLPWLGHATWHLYRLAVPPAG